MFVKKFPIEFFIIAHGIFVHMMSGEGRAERNGDLGVWGWPLCTQTKNTFIYNIGMKPERV